MTTPTSDTSVGHTIIVPTPLEMAQQAISGDLDSVLQSLALRASARERRLHIKSVEIIRYLTEHNKASLGEAEAAGAARAGIIPQDSEVTITALLERAKNEQSTPRF